MPTYTLGSSYGSNSGETISSAQLAALCPNTSWNWGVALTADMANHLDVTIIPDPAPPALTLAGVQAELLGMLDAQRIAVQSQGLNYTFPDNTSGVIQTRDPNVYPDIQNISGQASASLILISQGVTGSVLFFRDASNVTHNMTPTQMVAMCMAVNKWVSDVYTAKWNIAAQIQGLTTLAAAQTFDITQGWPTS